MDLQELKDKLEAEYVEEDIEKLQPKDRLIIYLNLMEFFTPKIQRSTFQADKEQKDIEIKVVE